MQSRIRKLASGQFGDRLAQIVPNSERLEPVVPENGVYDGSVILTSQNGVPMEGFVFSSGARIEILSNTFSGVSAKIKYRIHTANLYHGDFVSGKLSFVCPGEEFQIPISAAVQREYPGADGVTVHNLEEFYRLAEVSYGQALRVFCSPNFSKIFTDDEEKLLLTYRGLVSRFGPDGLSMEEFLIAAKQKERVRFLVPDAEITIEEISENVREYCLLRKEGSGYFQLQVRSDSDFLVPEKPILTQQDFVGNQCEVAFLVQYADLHAGKNMATITVEAPFWKQEIPVVVWNMPPAEEYDSPYRFPPEYSIHRQIRRRRIAFTELYLQYRLKRIAPDTWYREASICIDDLVSLDPENVWYPILRAHVQLIGGIADDARAILERVEARRLMENPGAWAYYDFVQTRLNPTPEVLREMSAEVRELSVRYPDSEGVLWARLYLDEELARNATRKLALIRDSMLRGMRSPMILLEACELICREPYLVSEIEEFELRVLSWGARHDALNLEVAEQVCRFATLLSGFSQTLYRVLCTCVETYPQPELVSAMCAYLVQSNRVGSAYEMWYRMGMEQKVRIAGLYEHYLMSLPCIDEQSMPKELKLYFRYACNLPREQKAALLALIIRNKKTEETIYREYLPVIDAFAKEQLHCEYISYDMQVIYSDYVNREELPYEDAYAFSKLVFAKRIQFTPSETMPKVVVCNGQFRAEEVLEISDGGICACLITADYILLYEDETGRRYAFDQEIVTQDLFKVYQYRTRLLEQCPDHPYLLLDQFYGHKKLPPLPRESIRSLQRMLETGKLRRKTRGRILSRVLKEMFAQGREELLLSEFLHIDTEMLTGAENGKLITLCAAYGFYEDAYVRAMRYGISHIPLERMLFLCDHAILEHPDEPFTLELCSAVFAHGYYNMSMLEYLVNIYCGSTKQMAKIRRAAVGFLVECSSFTVRLARQMIYTSTYVEDADEIFEEAVVGGLDRLAKMAYCCLSAHRFLAEDEPMPQVACRLILEEMRNRKNVVDLCRVAGLKYLVEESEEHPENVDYFVPDVIHETVAYLLKKGMYFSFFEKLDEDCKGRFQLEEICIIDYIQEADGPEPVLMYRYDDEEEFHSVPMRHRVDWVWSVALPLFPDESLQYYVTIEGEGAQKDVSGSGLCSRKEVSVAEGQSRYAALQNLLVYCNRKDLSAGKALIAEYEKMECLVNGMFTVE